MLNNRNATPVLWKSMVSLAATPLFLAGIWTTIASEKNLLAQSPTATSFPLPTSLPQGTSVKLDGSSSMSVINESLKQRFEEKFPGSALSLSSNGTDGAIKDLLAGKIDLAAVGRPLSEAEKSQGLSEVPVSREKIAIIIGPDNVYKGSLTFDQFAKIFRGEITNWSQVGGPNVPIRFVDRPNSSDTRQALRNYKVFQSAPFKTGATATQVTADDTAAVVKELGNDGISYAIAEQVVNQPNVKIVPMHNTLPTDPRYPFSQARGYVYKGQGNPAVLAFLGFATSAPGQEAVRVAKEQESTTLQPSPEAVAPSPQPMVEEKGQFPWWLLLLPLLGLPLLWWLLKGRGAAVPPVVAPTDEARMILTPRNCRDAYAYWEVPERYLTDARSQGGRDLKVRLYDVTDIPNMDRQQPHSLREFACNGRDNDLHLPIAVDNRDYVAELGYLTSDNQWIKIARSQSVRVPACAPGGVGLNTPTVAAAAAGAAAVGATVTPMFSRKPTEGVVTEPSRIIITPRTSDDAYVYWEVPESHKAALRQQGGQKLMLRVHDVTDTDLQKQSSHSIRQYEISENEPDKHVPIPLANRDYAAELGYLTADNRWLSLTRSAPVHVPAATAQLAADVNRVAAPIGGATNNIVNRTGETAGIVADRVGDAVGNATGLLGQTAQTAVAGGLAAAAGGAAAAKSFFDRTPTPDAKSFQQPEDCRIILVPRSSKDAYAYWEVAESYRKALRERGGRDLTLRVHDATNLDIDQTSPHSSQEYAVSEGDQDKHVPIPVSDRDYIAEIGYFTADHQWLRLIRSFHVHVPSDQ